MALTRGSIIDRVAAVLGDNSTDFRTYMETSFNHMLYALYDMHDWEWKHKDGTFNTVSGTEEYNLLTSSPVIRSAQDVEIIYDKTNGRVLNKLDMNNLRKRYPKEDESGQPTSFAVWNRNEITLHPNPNGIYVQKYLYLATATESTLDADTLNATLGLPPYIHYLFEKMCMAEGMFQYDDNRRNKLLEEIEVLWKPRAIEADMKHLESNARFKFWEEELAATGIGYDDYLSRWWSTD